MACVKKFWEDPYLEQLETTVTSVQDDIITLKETILFAFSGGQQSDSGTINGLEVLEARKEDKEIYYKLAKDHGLKVGDLVHTEIDWDKRYKLMKLHFAAELVLEWVYQNYNHPEKIGANISEDKARVDFYWDGNINSVFPELNRAFAQLVEANLEIESNFSDVQNEVRYWRIDGFAKVPCGGTHIKRTGEIGAVRFKRSNTGKGKERIEILLKTQN
ncbi:alanyl-tRNA editing protein [Fusibacter ferrireducens]|uniref:Alanyl-tRNA editing protein n=1 Tax=Fusibacter ferrireducens TaxID=2785058 RepID=A0ABR9ZPL6_9FIRM|nr:alanyl-tRNA editing protein [Fusibacter ferrireducens]MBF4692384.1 alanyl-tRNA editing protein [Fusibacter ferrireducens]